MAVVIILEQLDGVAGQLVFTRMVALDGKGRDRHSAQLGTCTVRQQSVASPLLFFPMP